MGCAMEINSLVSQVWGDTLRLGLVTDKVTKKDGWAYLDIAWFQDDAYEAARSSAIENNHVFKDGDCDGLYRVDHVQAFDFWKAHKFCIAHASKEINFDWPA